jgi:hypothetical protein
MNRWFTFTHLMPTVTLPRHPRWFARVVLACLCAAVLVPTLSRLLQAAQGLPSWQVVCRSDSTGQPLKLMKVGLPGSEPESMASHDDCPMCALQHQAWAPPSLPRWGLLPRLADGLLPTLFLRSHRPLFAWAAPRPRGPPSLV